MAGGTITSFPGARQSKVRKYGLAELDGVLPWPGPRNADDNDAGLERPAAASTY